ncbi:MAG: acyl carrier protein [Bacillota bacterium]
MGKEEILDRIREMLVEQLGLDESEIFPDAEFAADLGADSLDLVELIMSMEEEFDLNIPDEDVEEIVTVGDAVNYIEQHME